jgi:hypothetical protein
LFNPEEDSVAVLGAEGDGFEDKQIEGSGEYGGGHLLPNLLRNVAALS